MINDAASIIKAMGVEKAVVQLIPRDFHTRRTAFYLKAIAAAARNNI
jgi:hypothetical protein